MRVGVLALQGGFAAHVAAVRALGHEVRELRSARDLAGIDALVLPGGESSVMLDLLARDPALESGLDALVRGGAPLLATCAGLILSATTVREPAQRSFGWLDVDVRRNARGRQLASSEARDDGDRYDLVLIRAPRIVHVGPGVEVLATLDGEPVLVRQGQRVGATFHPELGADLAIHALALGDQRMRNVRAGRGGAEAPASGSSITESSVSALESAMR
jgi:5'-phosphate synthase pdxT subunit